MAVATAARALPEAQRNLKRRYGLLIDGEWREPASGRTFQTLNPATGEPIAEIGEGSAPDIDRAVAAARRAFESGPWPRMTPAERQRLIWRLADRIEESLEEFAQLETLDNGKPLTIARVADVPLTIEHFRYYAGWATKIEGETIPVSVPYAPGARFFNYTLREPVGVVGQIIPWNFPLLMAAWKLGPALAAGNCVVLKPAEQTPLSALRLGELIQEVGFPPGVVNIVTGFGETAGAPLAAHPDVDKVAFTGSGEVGKLVVQASAGNLKRVSLELGGKSPNIIFRDADLDAAAEGAASAIFFNHGQCCCAGSRLFVEKPAYDRVVERLSEQARRIKLGPGWESDTQMGPLVSEEQLRRVTGYLEVGQKEGACVVTGGGRPNGELKRGYFVEPTVLADVRNEMRIMQEEIFGPVVAVTPFSDIEEVVRASNDTTYGLAAGIWTNDVTKAHRAAAAIKAGTVWINCYNVFDAASPFGGYKQSGYGREMGHHALELYTQVKSVWVRLE